MENASEPKKKFTISDLGDSIHIIRVAEIMCLSTETVRSMTWDNRKKTPFIQGNELFGYYDGSNKFYIRTDSIRDYYACHHEKMRDFTKDKGLIREMEANLQELGEYIRKRKQDHTTLENKKIETFQKVEKKLCILGINALGPLHQNRESIVEILKRNGIVQILILNPESKAFKMRVNFEEEYNKKICGRLIAEYHASVAICRDIKNFSDNLGTFEVKVHSADPIMSIVMIYPDSVEYGQLNQNIYPEVSGLRGLTGRTLPLKKSDEKDIIPFKSLVEMFSDLWKSAKIVETT